MAAALASTAMVACSDSTRAVSASASRPAGPSATATATFTSASPSTEPAIDGLQQVLTAARDAGSPPPDETWASYQDGTEYWYFWPSPAGEFCWSRNSGLLLSCIPAKELPSGETPTAVPLMGPGIAADDQWLSFFIADLEQVQDLSCGDLHLTATHVADFPTARGHRTIYAFTTPWAVEGTLHAQVLRPDGSTATEGMAFSGFKADPSDSRFRTCG